MDNCMVYVVVSWRETTIIRSLKSVRTYSVHAALKDATEQLDTLEENHKEASHRKDSLHLELYEDKLITCFQIDPVRFHV